MLKLVDTSQICIIWGIFILDKVTHLRALLEPLPPRMVSEFTGRYPLYLVTPRKVQSTSPDTKLVVLRSVCACMIIRHMWCPHQKRA